jgi:hypothetical protein
LLTILLTSHYLLRSGSYSRPPLGRLSTYRAFDIGALHLTASIRNHACIVLELDPSSVDTPEWACLSNDDGIEYLATCFWSTAPYGDADHVAHSSGRVAACHAALLQDGNQLHDLRASVVHAV